MEYKIIDIIKGIKDLVVNIQKLKDSDSFTLPVNVISNSVDSIEILTKEQAKYKEILLNSDIFLENTYLKTELSENHIEERFNEVAKIFGKEQIVHVNDVNDEVFNNFGHGLASLLSINHTKDTLKDTLNDTPKDTQKDQSDLQKTENISFKIKKK